MEVNEATFEATALAVFQYQAENNPLYRKFIQYLKISPSEVQSLAQIPCVPISVFKYHSVQSSDWIPETVFRSSGTTSTGRSQHLVKSGTWYAQNAARGFEQIYGNPDKYCFLALLPSYLENGESSLVYMIDHFIQRSRYAQSDFFLYNTSELAKVLESCIENRIPTFLVGVSYALLDFAEHYAMPLPSHIHILETGGMKGRRKELPKAELHQILRTAFQTQNIHSEYGMTELLSQGYAPSNGIFQPTPTLRVLVRDATDPLTYLPFGKTGGVNVIDLANVDTLSFIATDDLGKADANGTFEILGRFDASDLRGCNLLIG